MRQARGDLPWKWLRKYVLFSSLLMCWKPSTMTTLRPGICTVQQAARGQGRPGASFLQFW
jgi:hypothetical protein